MKKSYDYLELLKYCLHEDMTAPFGLLSDICWHDLLDFAKKQSLVGVYWSGISRAYDEEINGKAVEVASNKPTDSDVLEWLSVVRKTQKRNVYFNEKAKWVTDRFRREGFDTCVLKGQGNAMFYPEPSLRMPGDIDIWVRPKGGSGSCDRQVIAYCRQFVPEAKACYHHIDFISAGYAPVEVHYRPSWVSNPFYNNRIQDFFEQHASSCFLNATPHGFNVPTWEFNVVYQLCHIYNHLLHEGIGMRQIVDFYYLLMNRPEESDTERAIYYINRCGLRGVAGAVSWLLMTVLAMPAEQNFIPVDRRRGRFLLHEIVLGGNFGKYDSRMLSGVYDKPIMKNIQRLVRDCRMLAFFPTECLCEPFFRLWHFFWRWSRRERGEREIE